MTKAQEVYERVNALVESGTTKADAFRQLAEEYGQPVKSLQGSYYSHSRKANGGSSPRRARKRETTPAEAVEQAKATLERAIESIDAEIEVAKERMNEAKAEFESLKASASDRKAEIKTKIEALS
jgi:chromosome segregation ATPase